MGRRTTGYARRADTNHVEIVAAFKQFNASVTDLRLVGHGTPDLLIGFQGRDRQVEVKTAKGKVRAGQDAYAEAWKGCRPVVVRSIEDVIALVGPYGLWR